MFYTKSKDEGEKKERGKGGEKRIRGKEKERGRGEKTKKRRKRKKESVVGPDHQTGVQLAQSGQPCIFYTRGYYILV